MGRLPREDTGEIINFLCAPPASPTRQRYGRDQHAVDHPGPARTALDRVSGSGSPY